MQYEKKIINKVHKLSYNNILVCAHKGQIISCPENSLASINKAIQLKIDIIEVDVRTTSDNKIIIHRDETLERTTTGKGFIRDYTYNELLKFNLKYNHSVTKEKIPLLEDVIKLSKGKILLNLDLKDVCFSTLYKLLSKYQMVDDVISFVGNTSLISEIEEKSKSYAIMPLANQNSDIINFSKLNYGIIHFTNNTYNINNLTFIKQKNILVFINSIGQADENLLAKKYSLIDNIVKFNPTIIQTNYPIELLEYLRKNNKHK